MEAETERRMGTAMTDEEHQRLCADLRRCKSSWLEDVADELERLAKENHILKLGMEAWPEILKDRDDRLAALAQSDAGPVREALKRAVMLLKDAEVICSAVSDRGEATYYDMAKAFKQGHEQCRAALAQSDAEPAPPQTLRDAAENLLIAIGMGWDIEGCVENLRAALAQSDADQARIAPETCPHCFNEDDCDSVGVCRALAQSDAEPVALKARFEEWAFTRGHRNFTKSGGDYLLPEIQKDWLDFKASGPADYLPIGGAGNGA